MSAVAIPTSFGQRRLWFLEQLQPGSPAYHMTSAVRLRGMLDIAALDRALQALVARHESLRTTFRADGGVPMQIVHDSMPIALAFDDFTASPPELRDSGVQRAIAEEAGRPFDLALGPLLRVRLLRLEADDHVAVFVAHHIVSDGWSLTVLVRDLATLYRACAADPLAAAPERSLPELPVQYADYAEWEREWWEGPAANEHLAYWREQLADLPEDAGLPIDRVRPATPSFRGGRVAFAVPAPVAQALRKIARTAGATPFMLLLAGIKVLLARHAGTTEIVIGTPIANRSRPETEGLIGFFVNTLVLRTRWAADAAFADVLAAVRATCIGAYAHAELPFERLVQELAPDRDSSRTPFFQVMFVMDAPPPLPSLEGLQATPWPAASDSAKFDLTFAVTETGDGFRGTIDFARDLFDESTVSTMAARLGRLLAAIAADPNERVSALPFLTPEEHRDILAQASDVVRTPSATDIVRRIAQHVAETPHAPAVRHGESMLTFRDLDAAAVALVSALRPYQVGTEQRVGVCLDVSPALVIAWWAILRSGAVCVPVDPRDPAERRCRVLAAAGVRAIITAERVAWGAGAPAPTLSVEDIRGRAIASTTAATEPIVPPVTSEQLAYVIYTSGSTGAPKGVMVSHGSLANHLAWANETLLRGRPIAATTSPAFDASLKQLLAPLVEGRAVSIPVAAGDLTRLLDHWRETSDAIFNGVPAVWDVLLRQLEADPDLPGPSCLLLGGDVLPNALLERTWRRVRGAEIWNLYGPTEATVNASAERCDPDRPVTIGRPIAGTRLHVLGPSLELLPRGVEGELYLGGPGVARGYVDAPDLTAARFVPDPYGPPGSRLYRSGDRARLRADGRVECLGRVDGQLKIRGVRIDPREIESVLLAHPGVTQAVVLAQPAGVHHPRLVAYVVGQPVSGVAPGPRELETGAPLITFLRERLPDSLMPGHVFELPSFPLTPSGKLDRRALPVPSGPAPLLAADGAGGPEVDAVSRVFAEVLGVEALGVHDSFFASGGHSLAAVQVASRLRALFEIDVPVRAVFDHPTAAALGRHVGALSRAHRTGGSGARVSITPREGNGPSPLSFGQERLWVLDQMGFAGAAYHLPHAVYLDGVLDVAGLEQSVSDVMMRHEALRTVITSVDGRPAQIVQPASHFMFLQVDLSDRDADAQASLIDEHVRAESRERFDLARGPLLRGRLLRLSPTRHVALFTLHHIAADAWSMRIFVRELADRYSVASAGDARPSAAAVLSVQYQDYAAWQREWLSTEEADACLQYWRGHLTGAPSDTGWPTDRPRPPLQSHRGARVSFDVPDAVGPALRRLCASAGVTPFMACLTAFNALLARATGRTDVVVGTPVANRAQPEVEPLIGFFANTLVLRTRWDGDVSFRTLLGHVKNTCLDAYSHQDYPFERLVEAIVSNRDPSRTPLFQVMFLLQDAAPGPLTLGDVQLTPFATPVDTVKFDFTVALAATGAGWHGTIDYNLDLFDAATMTTLASRFVDVLQRCLADPDLPLSAIDITTPEERRSLRAWNNVDEAVSPESLVDAVRRHARHAPEAPAVRRGEQVLSYGALNDAAMRLASRLQELEIGSEDRVAMCLDVSSALVVAWVGCFAAGAAVVPLDPRDPFERRARLVADAGCCAVVTTSAIAAPGTYAHATSDEADLPIILLDRLLDGPHVPVAASDIRECPPPHPEQLAYVIYTSGSTGAPKGVMVTHGSLLTYLTWIERAVLRGRPVLATTRPTFDASLKQVLGPLLQGRTVWIPRDTDDFERWPEEWRGVPGAVFNGVPAVWDAILTRLEGRPDDPGPAAILLGGDALPPALVERTWRRLPAVEVWNLYGPTEATANAAADRVTPGAAIALGRTVAGTRFAVLDRWGQPAPANVVGELHIGGAGLARGYLDAADLTAARFVPDPHGVDERGARLYRTGDRARVLADGRIELLGRLDTQIKIRGSRVELGEVEAALERQPGVSRAVVIRREQGSRVQLVACVVPSSDTLAPEALREALRRQLPAYMVPSRIVSVPELPLNAHGKIDRRAIEQLEVWKGAEATSRDERPVTATEAILLSIWRELLNQPTLGRDDNFFDVGGDSITSIQIVARARQRGLALAPRQLFEHQTIAELARVARPYTGGEAPRGSEVTNGAEKAPDETVSPASFPLAPGLTQAELDAIRRRWDAPTERTAR